jgi:flavin reductase (DIM6/NTAB) family NADH-FMN oxidoreductase RutF
MKTVSIEKAFTQFKPENIVFVISYDKKNKRPSGMIAGWNMKCSSGPHMFAVALWKKGYTHKLIQQTKEFVIAIPNKKIEKAIGIFGMTHGDKVDKFKIAKLKTLPAKYIKPPLLADATINLECKVEQEIDTGDHIIFIGKVLAAYVDEKRRVLLNMGKVNGKRVFREF